MRRKIKVESVRIIWKFPGTDYYAARCYDDFRLALAEAREMKAAGYLIQQIRRSTRPARRAEWGIIGYSAHAPEGAPQDLWDELASRAGTDLLYNPKNIRNCDECQFNIGNIYGLPCGQQNCCVQCYIDRIHK